MDCYISKEKEKIIEFSLRFACAILFNIPFSKFNILLCLDLPIENAILNESEYYLLILLCQISGCTDIKNKHKIKETFNQYKMIAKDKDSLYNKFAKEKCEDIFTKYQDLFFETLSVMFFKERLILPSSDEMYQLYRNCFDSLYQKVYPLL